MSKDLPLFNNEYKFSCNGIVHTHKYHLESKFVSDIKVNPLNGVGFRKALSGCVVLHVNNEQIILPYFALEYLNNIISNEVSRIKSSNIDINNFTHDLKKVEFMRSDLNPENKWVSDAE